MIYNALVIEFLQALPDTHYHSLTCPNNLVIGKTMLYPTQNIHFFETALSTPYQNHRLSF